MSLNIAEITQNEVYLSSAAMPPIYLYKASSNAVEELMQSGLPLGGLKDETFNLITRTFEYGDVLIQLSDGLPEAPNAKGELYDYDRLKSLIQASGHLSAQQIIDVLIESVDRWLEGNRNPDDITLGGHTKKKSLKWNHMDRLKIELKLPVIANMELVAVQSAEVVARHMDCERW